MNIYISVEGLFINGRKYIFSDTIFKVYLAIINASLLVLGEIQGCHAT